MDILRTFGNADVTGNSAAFLCHAELIHRGTGAPFKMCGHGDHGTDSDNPGATNAGDQDVVSVTVFDAGTYRLGE